MANDDNWFLAKLRDQEPEQFIFLNLPPTLKPKEHSKSPMSETEAHAELQKFGLSEAEIIARFEHARKNPI